MISVSSYFYRTLDYLLVQNAAFFDMRVAKRLSSDWSGWARWVMDHRHLMAVSNAQVGQDLFVSYLLLKHFGVDVEQQQGQFLEFGAFDGLTHSNSYLFEKLGWSGTLIEPDPENANLCAQTRRATIIQACVLGNDIQEDTVRFRIVEEDGELSSLVGYGKAETIEFDEAILEVPAVHLDKILSDMGPVDFVSIDTEGSEPDLLANSDLPVRPRVVLVEHNNDPEKKSALRRLMKEKDYGVAHRHGDFFDDAFIDLKTAKAL